MTKEKIEKIEEINGRNESSSQSLFRAIIEGKYDVAKLLIENGADLNTHNKFGYTALMRAILSGNYDIARLLIENRAGLNAQNQDGQTALNLAIMGGRDDLAKLLIENGAGLNIKNSFDDTALNLAIIGGRDDLVKLFPEAMDLDDKMASYREGEFIDLNSDCLYKRFMTNLTHELLKGNAYQGCDIRIDDQIKTEIEKNNEELISHFVIANIKGTSNLHQKGTTKLMV